MTQHYLTSLLLKNSGFVTCCELFILLNHLFHNRTQEAYRHNKQGEKRTKHTSLDTAYLLFFALAAWLYTAWLCHRAYNT